MNQNLVALWVAFIGLVILLGGLRFGHLVFIRAALGSEQRSLGCAAQIITVLFFVITEGVALVVYFFK